MCLIAYGQLQHLVLLLCKELDVQSFVDSAGKPDLLTMTPVHQSVFLPMRSLFASASMRGKNMRLHALTKLNSASDTGTPCISEPSAFTHI